MGFRPPGLLATQVAPTAGVQCLQGGRGVYIRAEHVSFLTCIGHASRPIRSIDSAGTCTPLDSQLVGCSSPRLPGTTGGSTSQGTWVGSGEMSFSPCFEMEVLDSQEHELGGPKPGGGKSSPGARPRIRPSFGLFPDAAFYLKPSSSSSNGPSTGPTTGFSGPIYRPRLSLQRRKDR